MNEVLKKSIGKLKSPTVLLVLGLCGIVLICLSSFTGSSKKEQTADGVGKASLSTAQYREELEKSIKGMVSDITGTENVTVVITLESGIKYSYADAKDTNSTSKTENNGESGSSQTKQSYITVKTSDGGEQALLVTEIMPEIRGVAIVCDNGDNEAVSEKIKNAVMAALNITSKRVYIAGGNTNEKR